MTYKWHGNTLPLRSLVSSLHARTHARIISLLLRVSVFLFSVFLFIEQQVRVCLEQMHVAMPSEGVRYDMQGTSCAIVPETPWRSD